MFQVTLYTDGSCIGNPGPGGYAAVLSCNGRSREISGGAKHTTNNRMELQAVIAGLQALKQRCQVRVVTDSQYSIIVETLLNGAHAKANRDLASELRQLANQYLVTVQHVRGHSGHQMNELVDQLAYTAAYEQKRQVSVM